MFHKSKYDVSKKGKNASLNGNNQPNFAGLSIPSGANSAYTRAEKLLNLPDTGTANFGGISTIANTADKS